MKKSRDKLQDYFLYLAPKSLGLARDRFIGGFKEKRKMFKSRCVRTAIIISSLIFFNFAAAAAGIETKPKGDKLLSLIPAESMFCVRVNNLDYTLGQIDQFLAGASPVPLATAAMVRMQLATILGSPELNGVNMNGSFTIFATLAAGQPVGEDFISVLVPVTNYQKLVGENPNIAQPDANGVSKITGDIGGLIVQIGDFALVKSPKSYNKIVTEAKSLSAAEAKGLADILDADEIKQATTEPVWAYGNVQLASKAFGPMLLGKIEEMKKMMESMKAGGQGPMGNPAEIMDMYADVLELFMKETKSLSVAVVPKPSVFNITSTISALPGTEMADMFTADTPAKQNKFLNYLEDGAVMNVSGGVTGELNAKAMDFFATMMAKDMNEVEAAKIKSFASDCADVFSGNDAMSFSVDPNNKPPFAVKYVIGIKDKDKYDKLIEQGIELFNTGGIADFYKNFGMEISFTLKHGVDNYKGHSIDSAKFVMKSTEPNSPQGQIINAIYGEGFEYRWAMVNGLLAAVMGGNVDKAMHELIDEVKAGGPKQLAGEMKSALALIPGANKADFVGTYNFLRYFGIISAFMPIPMPQTDIPTKNNIAFAGKAGDGKMAVEIAFPKEHLMEVMGIFQGMQQQRTQARQTFSAANLRGIGKTCLIYANDYEDKFPPNLQELVEKEALSLKTLESPLKPKGFDGPSYIYISGQTVKMYPDNVVVYENPEFCSDVINVLFIDTHVEAMKPEAFLQKLEETYKRLGREMPDVKFKESSGPGR